MAQQTPKIGMFGRQNNFSQQQINAFLTTESHFATGSSVFDPS